MASAQYCIEWVEYAMITLSTHSLLSLIHLLNGGPRLPLLFTSHSYRHLEGHFLAEMAGKQNWLEWQGKKM